MSRSHPALRPAWQLLDGDRTASSPLLSTSWAALDAALGGGLPRADLVEVLSERDGEGGLTFALALARLRRACPGDPAPASAGEPASASPLPSGAIVLIDSEEGAILPGRSWPEGAVRVRPRGAAGVLEALDRVLRCPGMVAAVGVLPAGARLDLAASARLRQAARAGGTLGLLCRRLLARAPGDGGRAGRSGQGPSAAAVRLVVRRAACPGPEEALTVEVLRVRGWPGAGASAAVAV